MPILSWSRAAPRGRLAVGFAGGDDRPSHGRARTRVPVQREMAVVEFVVSRAHGQTLGTQEAALPMARNGPALGLWSVQELLRDHSPRRWGLGCGLRRALRTAGVDK